MSSHPQATIIRKEQAEVEEIEGKVHHWYSKPGLTDTHRLHYIHVTLPPGAGHSFHHHPMEEVLHLLSGTAEQWIEQERHILGPGDALHIPPGIVHATFNRSEKDIEFIAVLAAADPESSEPMTVEVDTEEPWKSLSNPSS